MRGAWLVGIGALVCAGLARADTSDWQVREHRLEPAEAGSESGPVAPFDEPDSSDGQTWAQTHLAAGRDLADPFIGLELYPEVSAGMLASIEELQSNGEIEYAAWLNLQLYLFEFRLPISSRTFGESRPHVRMDVKLPYAIPGHEEHHFALTAGAVVINGMPSFSKSSHAQLMYGFGLGGLSLQARCGYGYDQFMPSLPLKLGLMYGGVFSVRAGPFQPMVELDAMRVFESHSDRFTIVPGLRIFPGNDDSVQIGVAGLLTFGRGDDAAGRRFGGVLEISYNFL